MKTSTICVGGLAAGKYYSAEGNTLVVAHTAPLNFEQYYHRAPLEAVATLQQSYYRRMSLRYCIGKSEQEFVFWVDSDRIKNEYDLIRELAGGYNPVGTYAL